MANRIEKINTEILRAVSDIINHKLKDPRISGIISIINLKTSADLKHADVFISIFKGEDDKKTIELLNNSSGYIRNELSKMLSMRTIPKLHFVYDNSMEYSQKISKILEDIHDDKKV